MGHIDMRTKASKNSKSSQKYKEETCTLNSNIKECKNARQVGSVIIHCLT